MAEISTATTTASPSPVTRSLTIDENKNPPNLLDDTDDLDDSNIQAVTSGDTPYTSAATFEDLSLSPELLKGLYVEMKFQKPSKIQAISLPMILSQPHRDLIVQAHNCSGKTMCFLLGMLSCVDPKLQAPQALCICPTRDLAIQNTEVLRKMGKYTGIASECLVASLDPLQNPFRRESGPVMAQVVIGTPGTIHRWMCCKKLGATMLKILVFDEADQMLNEFQHVSLRIMRAIQKVNSNCQVLLFSATFNDTVTNFVSRTVKKDHNKLFVKTALDAVKQCKVHCPDELAKIHAIKDYILELGENMGQAIIFVRIRDSAKVLHKALVDMGYEVTSTLDGLDYESRDKIVKEFRDGLTQVLISSDFLARGFDQQQVNLVINFDLPIKHFAGSFRDPEPDCEVYLHRVGWAARFGPKGAGAVFNLICDETDEKLMSKIESHLRIHVTEVLAQSVEDFKAAPKEAGWVLV